MKKIFLIVVFGLTGCATAHVDSSSLLQLRAEKSGTIIYNYYNVRCLELTQDCSSKRDPKCLPLRICQRDRLEFGEKLNEVAQMFSSLSCLCGVELKRAMEVLEYEVRVLDRRAEQIQTRK